MDTVDSAGDTQVRLSDCQTESDCVCGTPDQSRSVHCTWLAKWFAVLIRVSMDLNGSQWSLNILNDGNTVASRSGVISWIAKFIQMSSAGGRPRRPADAQLRCAGKSFPWSESWLSTAKVSDDQP